MRQVEVVVYFNLPQSLLSLNILPENLLQILIPRTFTEHILQVNDHSSYKLPIYHSYPFFFLIFTYSIGYLLKDIFIEKFTI